MYYLPYDPNQLFGQKSRNVSVADAIATIFVLFCHIIQTCLLLGHCVSSWCHCRRRCRQQNGGGGDFPNLFLPSPRSASTWFFIFFSIRRRHRQRVCNRVHCERANLAFWLFGRYCRHQDQSWWFENDLECPVQICHLKNKISYKRWICATDINAHMPKINFSLLHQIGSDEGAKWKEKRNKACFTFVNPPIQPFKVKISSVSFHAQSETCFNIFVLHLPLISFTFF